MCLILACGPQEAASEHIGTLRESLDWLLGQESMELGDELPPSLGAESGLKTGCATAVNLGAAR